MKKMSTTWESLLPKAALQQLDQTAFLSRCRLGVVNKMELETFLVQQYHYARHFTRYLCALLANLSNESDRLALTENLFEEMGLGDVGDEPHAKIYRDMLTALRLDPAKHPALSETSSLVATMLRLCSAPDPISAPSSPRGRLVYGAGIGLLTYWIRTWGGYPDAIAFAVLLMNLLVPVIDKHTVPRIYGHETAGEVAAGPGAADVAPVGEAHGKGEQPAFEEDRPDRLHVGQVIAADLGQVQEPDVARLQALGRHALQELLHREAHDAEMDGDVAALGDEVALVVGDGR